MTDVIQNYISARNAFFEYFGCNNSSESVDDFRNDYWQIKSSSVGWSYENPIEAKADEWVYSEELAHSHQAIYKGKEYTLVYVRSSTGDGNSFILFSNSKELPDWKPKWE